DLIDLLVIDEASQVSIAESISLMLRAKQTIVFGDELQYGAVGAVNVSHRYSTHYFKDILSDFALDRDQAISEEERDRIASEVSETPDEDEEESSRLFPVDPGTREWLKTFSVRTSTLAFAKALSNYSESLNVHFRSFPEIISYSNEVFYKESQIELITNRIRTKPIKEVLRFIKVETEGFSGKNVNLDEIEAIQRDLDEVIRNGYKGSIGIICSFREQTARMEEELRKELSIYPELVRNHKLSIWFVGDVQGEERDLVYYSFVQDKKIDNADLRTIYPIIGGTADNIRRLKMQRLNVGFSRAKDIMVFVHSMSVGDYSDTRLGDALRHYERALNSAQDQYVADERIFGSPAEKELYGLILQTPFFQENRDKLRLIAQFEIGKYIREEYHRNIPKYRVDFLLTMSDAGKEKSLIVEYDGVEFHTRNPDIVTRHNFDQEYLEYDAERQLELESYGYSFLRINKFSLLPHGEHKTGINVLDHLLERCFSD
ncbi:MAG TPA: AAA domain-containing protein, partial [Spirochaetia bacterium]|nr:AAA domain-containing protein [Spirochaetia bacterium]